MFYSFNLVWRRWYISKYCFHFRCFPQLCIGYALHLRIVISVLYFYLDKYYYL